MYMYIGVSGCIMYMYACLCLFFCGSVTFANLWVFHCF